MIDALTAETTYLAAAIVYVVAMVVLAVWTRRLESHARVLGYAFVGMIGLSAASMLLMWQGLGSVTVGDELVDVPRFVADAIAYPFVFAVTAVIAGASRRLIAASAGVMFLMRLGFEVSSIVEGLLGLLSAFVMVGGYVVLLYLFWGPAWHAAGTRSDGRRLLYWKCRNLIGFLIGMLIVLGVLALLDSTYDPFVIETARQYLDVLIRVGYAGFVFASIGVLDDTAGIDLRETLSSTGTG